jgi:hypothetical protein
MISQLQPVSSVEPSKEDTINKQIIWVDGTVAMMKEHPSFIHAMKKILTMTIKDKMGHRTVLPIYYQ